jgi:transposase
LRKVGVSKEHRVDPQVLVGLLTDQDGFPLDVNLFEGNEAETKTIVPVLEAFRLEHGVDGLIVVADAGMLSAANLDALEGAGFSFIVGSKQTKAPYDLADHFHRHGDHFKDGQVTEATRRMGRGKKARVRRVVWQYDFKRHKNDDRAINAMMDRAERIAAGELPMKKARFLSVEGATKAVNQALVDRARSIAGLKGYVTNVPVDTMTGQQIIDAYHHLYQVELSFRMTKSDLRGRPVFSHVKDSIEAHLTIVFAALAVSRHLQDATGKSIKKIVQTLHPVRAAVVAVNGREYVIEPEIPDDAREILAALAGKTGY